VGEGGAAGERGRAQAEALCAALLAQGEATVTRQGAHFFIGKAMVELAGALLPAEPAAQARPRAPGYRVSVRTTVFLYSGRPSVACMGDADAGTPVPLLLHAAPAFVQRQGVSPLRADRAC
jgi:hypothetical protein